MLLGEQGFADLVGCHAVNRRFLEIAIGLSTAPQNNQRPEVTCLRALCWSMPPGDDSVVERVLVLLCRLAQFGEGLLLELRELLGSHPSHRFAQLEGAQRRAA